MKALLITTGLLAAVAGQAIAAEPGCVYGGEPVPVGSLILVHSPGPVAFQQCVPDSSGSHFFGPLFYAADVAALTPRPPTPADPPATAERDLLVKLVVSGERQAALPTDIYNIQARAYLAQQQALAARSSPTDAAAAQAQLSIAADAVTQVTAKQLVAWMHEYIAAEAAFPPLPAGWSRECHDGPTVARPAVPVAQPAGAPAR